MTYYYSLSLLLAATVVTSSLSLVLAYGLDYLIRDHNLHSKARAFRREQRKIRLALRRIDEDLTFVLAPQLAKWKAEM